jgi:type II secretory pathway pseudopilin PulG
MKSGNAQTGFTYLGALFATAALGVGLVSIAELWSHARQREKEAELVWVGEQFRQAIALYYQRSPGSVKRYPNKLEDLLEDPRHLTTARYLRRLYADPMTGKAEWGIVAAPGGGIMGVHSLSTGGAIRQRDLGRRYLDWRFIYTPPPRSP